MHANLITSAYWGSFRGRDVFLFRITGADGSYVELTNYGATVVSIVMPDRHNQMGHVVLGFPTLEGYLLDDCYLGATIGRYANRIANGTFHIDGASYHLEANDGDHSNHSGAAGLNSKVFEFEIIEDGISFSYLSPDGAGGFPGELQVVVTYMWKDLKLLMEYTAETNRKTPVNLTNHCYFNLSGDGSCLEQKLTVFAEHSLEAGEDHIPTGKIRSDAAMMFHKTAIRAKLQGDGKSLKGLNTCYVLEESADAMSKKVAELFDPASGRLLQVFTSYPGLLLYTGDYLRSQLPGHHGQLYKPFDGICLECQYFPDAPNHPNFPSPMLEPNQVYQAHISYEFQVHG